MGLVFGRTTAKGLMGQSCNKSPPNTDEERELDNTLNDLNIGVTPLVVPTEMENVTGQHIPQPCSTSTRWGKRASDGSSNVMRRKRAKGAPENDT